MGKSTISIVIFNSYVNVYQRGRYTTNQIMIHHYWPLLTIINHLYIYSELYMDISQIFKGRGWGTSKEQKTNRRRPADAAGKRVEFRNVPLAKTFFLQPRFVQPPKRNRKLNLHKFTTCLWLNISPTTIFFGLANPFIDDFPIKTSIYNGFSMAMLVITRGLAAANYKGCVSSASHGTHGTPMAHHGTQDAQMKDGPAGETFRVSGQEWARNPKKTGWPGRRKNQIGRMAGRMTSLKLKETEQKCWFFAW